MMMKIPLFLFFLLLQKSEAHKGGTPQERARIFQTVLGKLCTPSYNRNLACIGVMMTPRFLYINETSELPRFNFTAYLRSFPNLELSNFTLDVENAKEVPKSDLPFIPWSTVLPPTTTTTTVAPTTISSSTSVTPTTSEPTSNAPASSSTLAPTIASTLSPTSEPNLNAPASNPPTSGPLTNASTLSPAQNASTLGPARKSAFSPIPGPILTDYERQQVPLVKINVYYAQGPKNGTLAAYVYLMSYRPNEGGNAMIVVDQKNVPRNKLG